MVAVSPDEANGVLANARSIRLAARSGRLQDLLKGCRLALLTDGSDEARGDGSGTQTQLFVRAATEMGAQVVVLRPGLSSASPAQEIQTAARMLGQLYDAVECQGMDQSLVQQIALYAGQPVFHGLASAQHPTALLAERLTALDAGITEEDARCRVVQAVLLGTLA